MVFSEVVFFAIFNPQLAPLNWFSVPSPCKSRIRRIGLFFISCALPFCRNQFPKTMKLVCFVNRSLPGVISINSGRGL